MSGTIYLTKDIGQSADGSTISYDDFVKYWPKMESDVTVVINSAGGAVYDGLAIAEMIKAERKAGKTVHCKINGRCGSIATLVALACDDIEMSPSAAWFIHKSSISLEDQNSDDIKRISEELDRVDAVMTAAYAAKTGRPPEEIMELMKQEKPLGAEDARKLGFIDRVSQAFFRAVAKMRGDRLTITTEETTTMTDEEKTVQEKAEEVAAPAAEIKAVEVSEPKAAMHETVSETETETEEEEEATEEKEEAEESKHISELRELVEMLKSEIETLKEQLVKANGEADNGKAIKAKLTQVPTAREPVAPGAKPSSAARLDRNANVQL